MSRLESKHTHDGDEWDTAVPCTLTDQLDARLEALSATDIRRLNAQLLRCARLLTRNSLLHTGIPAGTYCLARIRQENGSRQVRAERQDPKSSPSVPDRPR